MQFAMLVDDTEASQRLSVTFTFPLQDLFLNPSGTQHANNLAQKSGEDGHKFRTANSLPIEVSHKEEK